MVHVAEQSILPREYYSCNLLHVHVCYTCIIIITIHVHVHVPLVRGTICTCIIIIHVHIVSLLPVVHVAEQSILPREYYSCNLLHVHVCYTCIIIITIHVHVPLVRGTICTCIIIHVHIVPLLPVVHVAEQSILPREYYSCNLLHIHV